MVGGLALVLGYEGPLSFWGYAGGPTISCTTEHDALGLGPVHSKEIYAPERVERPFEKGLEASPPVWLAHEGRSWGSFGIFRQSRKGSSRKYATVSNAQATAPYLCAAVRRLASYGRGYSIDRGDDCV